MKKGIILNEWRCNPLAQCVRVNKLVVCLCLSVFLLISPPPIPSFKHTKYFLSPFLPDWPPLSLSLSLTFFILYYFPYHCLSTPVFLHTLFHQSYSPRQLQFSTVMGICTLCKAIWFCPSVIPVMFHCQLTQTMHSFTAVDILSLTCGLRQWYVLGPAQERTH